MTEWTSRWRPLLIQKRAMENTWKEKIAAASSAEETLILEETMLSDPSFLQIQTKAALTPSVNEVVRAVQRLLFLLQELQAQTSAPGGTNILHQLLERTERLTGGIARINDETMRMLSLDETRTIFHIRQEFILAHPIADPVLALRFQQETEKIEATIVERKRVSDGRQEIEEGLQRYMAALNERKVRNYATFVKVLPLPDKLSGTQSDHQCPLCHVDFGTNGKDVVPEHPVLLPCGHIFGQNCLFGWLDDKANFKRCPACRFCHALAFGTEFMPGKTSLGYLNTPSGYDFEVQTSY